MQGLIYDLPFAQYASLHGLNASAIKAGRLSMKHMRQAIVSKSKTSDAMAKGSLVHSLFLDKDFWDKTAMNDESRNSKSFKDFASICESKGLTVLKTEQADELRAIETSLRSNGQAVELLNGCQFEVSAKWEHPSIGECKCRFDALATDGSYFIDFKTCSDIDPQAVGRQFVNMGYDIQYGWYRSGNEAINGKRAVVYQFNIETSAPYDFTIDKVYPESCDLGLSKAVEIATKYRDCERSGEFKGVRSHISMMQVPEWYKEQLDLSGDIPFGGEID